MRPAMLALSTFRRSDNAVRLAIEKASAEGRDLVVVFVADVNLARYLVGSDLTLYPQIRESFEEELLEEHRQMGQEAAEAIVRDAEAKGLTVRTYVEIGRFALKCLEVVERERPEFIVTTRSKRPAWVKRFFGSPVDYLIAHAGCPVMEA